MSLKEWRKERKELYSRAPVVQQYIETGKKALAIGAVIVIGYAALLTYQAKSILHDPGFEAAKNLKESSQRIYHHLTEDTFFMKSVEGYLLIKGKVNKDFQFDAWQFLDDCEKMKEHQGTLEQKLETFGTISISSRTLHQPKRYILSHD